MKVKITEFDASAYLTNEMVINEYLAAAAEDKNPNVLIEAIRNVAKARSHSKK